MKTEEIIEQAVRTVESSPRWVLERSGMGELLEEYRQRALPEGEDG